MLTYIFVLFRFFFLQFGAHEVLFKCNQRKSQSTRFIRFFCFVKHHLDTILKFNLVVGQCVIYFQFSSLRNVEVNCNLILVFFVYQFDRDDRRQYLKIKTSVKKSV